MYARQLHVLHSQFSDAPCAHTAREATMPCAYNNSTSYTLNSLTHHASKQQERLQSLVLTTQRLPLSILQRTLRPHSEKGHKALYLQQLHVFCSQFSDATLHPHSGKGNPALCLRQWDKQPSPASVAGKATQPCVSGSGKGNPALPP